MTNRPYFWRGLAALVGVTALAWGPSARGPAATADTFEVNDAHFHLTNYVQQGTNIHDFLRLMGTKVGRTAIFGIPLQQQGNYLRLFDQARRRVRAWEIANITEDTR